MKNTENYRRSYERWTKRVKGISVESAKSRLKDINEQLSPSTFEGDEYLSAESRNEILLGRQDALIDYLTSINFISEPKHKHR